MRQPAALVAVALILALGGTPVLAQNWVSLLKNTPAEHFDEEDLRLFLETARRAMNEGADHQTFRWENPATKASGEITLLRSFKWKEHSCREVGVHNQAGAYKSRNTFNLCRVEQRWRLLSREQLKKK